MKDCPPVEKGLVAKDFYSTNLNHRLNTFDDLATRIAYDLGYPVINVEAHTNQVYDSIAKACEKFSKYAGYTEEYLVFDSRLYEKGKGIRVDQLFTMTPDMREMFQDPGVKSTTKTVTATLLDTTNLSANTINTIDSFNVRDIYSDPLEYTFIIKTPDNSEAQVSKFLVGTSFDGVTGKTTANHYSLVYTGSAALANIDVSLGFIGDGNAQSCYMKLSSTPYYYTLTALEVNPVSGLSLAPYTLTSWPLTSTYTTIVNVSSLSTYPASYSALSTFNVTALSTISSSPFSVPPYSVASTTLTSNILTAVSSFSFSVNVLSSAVLTALSSVTNLSVSAASISSLPLTGHEIRVDQFNITDLKLDSGEYVLKATELNGGKNAQVSKMLIATKWLYGQANYSWTEYGLTYTSADRIATYTLDLTGSNNQEVFIRATGYNPFAIEYTKYASNVNTTELLNVDVIPTKDIQLDYYVNNLTDIAGISGKKLTHDISRVRGFANVGNILDSYDVSDNVPDVVEYTIRTKDTSTFDTQIHKVLVTSIWTGTAVEFDISVHGTGSTDGSVVPSRNLVTFNAITDGKNLKIIATSPQDSYYEVMKTNLYKNATTKTILSTYSVAAPTVSGGYDSWLEDYRRVVDVFSWEQGTSQGVNTLFTLEQTLAQQTYFSYAMGKYGFDLISWYTVKDWLDVREKLLSQKHYYKFDDRRQTLHLIPEPGVGIGNRSHFWALVGAYVEKPIRDLVKEQWVYEYALADVKIKIARIRGKYGNTNLFGSGSVNYSELLQEGREDKKELERELYEGAPGLGDNNPPMFFVG